MQRSAEYWQSYRRVRSNVAQHLCTIVSEASDCDDDTVLEPDSCATGNGTSDTSTCFQDNCNQTGLEDDFVQISTSPVNENSLGLPSNSCDQNFNFLNSDEEDAVSTFTESDSDSSESFSVDDTDLAYDLGKWASTFNIPHNAVKDLLCKLHPSHPMLPKDPRTLLKTKTEYEVRNVAGGSYHHFGLEKSLLTEIQSYEFPIDITALKIQLNIDGLPLFKSSNLQFWPILCRVTHPVVSKPFAVGIFLGNVKPDNVSDYLADLVDEINNLTVTGVHITQIGRPIHVEVLCVTCDTPARAFLKQTKGHSGYFGCDKCTQKGQYVNHRMTFPETNAPLRTDAQFDQMIDVEHHIGRSPFLNTNLGLVTQFPLDYMQLVCLGVMKRLLHLWTKGATRQGQAFILHVSDRLVALSAYMPREFLRKGRPLSELDRWKATEFRTFLVYTGQVVLKGLLPKVLYEHFRLLFVAIYCLSSSVFCLPYREFANQLLVAFVRQFSDLYGEDQYVYNIHGLVHLASDVSSFGDHESYSCFPFESYLGKLKKLVRKPNCPLQQVIRRISEKTAMKTESEEKVPNEGTVRKRHHNGPRLHEYVDYCQFQEILLPHYFLSVQQGNNCILCDDKVGLIRNILSPSEQSLERVFVVQWYRGILGCFYTEPLHSSDLRVFRVSRLHEDTASVKLENITCKCVLLPYKNDFVVVPLLHTLLA